MEITFPDIYAVPLKAHVNLFCGVTDADQEEVERLSVYPTLEVVFDYFPGSVGYRGSVDVSDIYVLGEEPNGFLTRNINLSLRAGDGIEWLEKRIFEAFEPEAMKLKEQAEAESDPRTMCITTRPESVFRPWFYREPKFQAE